MLHSAQTPVMDVFPWPRGRGFKGADRWWDYILSKEEKRRLDNLMGIALLDERVCERLLYERDDDLLMSFGLSPDTRSWLHSIKATSLAELAEAITRYYPEE